MHPADSDDFFQQSRWGSNGPSPQDHDQNQTTSEHGSSGKSKKKGKNAKGKGKGPKAVPETVTEDLYVCTSFKLLITDDYRIEQSPPSQQQYLPPSNTQQGYQDHHTNNNVVSPILGALGSLGDNEVAHRTDTWAQSVPFGKSPPSDLLDGDLPSGPSHPSSASPRPRPLNYGDGHATDLSRKPSTNRRLSQAGGSPFNQIPLPHHPQAHFYGAPDIDLGRPGTNRPLTDGGHSFCAFDSISSPSLRASRMGGNVLLVGTDGAMEVLAIEDRKTRQIGKLAGLNGRVVDAKILNIQSQNDPYLSRPHVAVVVHGPCQPDEEGQGHTSSAGSEAHDPGRHTSTERRSDRGSARWYQTKAEVYSFRTGDHIATLFASKPSRCLENLPGLPLFAPSPVGNLKLFASGNYIILASGISGEVYIYGFDSSVGYQCLGKTWTSIQAKETRRHSGSSNSTDPDASQNDSPHDSVAVDTPIVSLRGRWLAVVPPPSTARPSIQGTVPAALVKGRVYGLDARNPPGKASVTCATDVGDGETLFDKVARGVTQELVRGARWMGDQGLQAWNNYWNKDQMQSTIPRRPVPVETPQGQIFPPTHAQDTQAAPDPDSVSVLDLKRLEDGGEVKNALFNPVATFQVPNGCSFLSFSPSGLMLLTASKKGDVQYVWDLLQARYSRAGVMLSDDLTTPSTSARQVARYARLTASSIVDVIWAGPSGDRLAIITRKGTVHVFDLPRSAFQWPPFRRVRPNAKPPTEPTLDEVADGNAVKSISAAFKMVGDKTQPIFAAVRGRTPSAGSGPQANGFMPTAGMRGGKAVAAGLSKSMGAATGTVNTLRRVGENRLHLSGLSRDPATSRVIWTWRQGQPFLGLIDDGFFRLYRIKRAVPSNKRRPSLSVVGGKELDLKLPAHLQQPSGPIPIGSLHPEPMVSASLALPTSHSEPSTTKSRCEPLSQAEIETNAPYQPFHTDQRVNLFILDDQASGSTGQWVFGNDLPMAQVHVRRDDRDAVDEPGLGDEMENHVSLSNSTGNGEEVVITTRRKKKHSPSPTSHGVDDGFFEDDCEVLDFARDRV